jgi:hypothetical protein
MNFRKAKTLDKSVQIDRIRNWIFSKVYRTKKTRITCYFVRFQKYIEKVRTRITAIRVSDYSLRLST